jgi:glycosyltransferase involved in cell wall biosynthesis
MNVNANFDLTYVTIDSIAEGVGSSQILPLIQRHALSGLKINLITFEKISPSSELIDSLKSIGVSWSPLPFGPKHMTGGISRINSLRREIRNTNLIHARSDLPAVSAIASQQAPVLWDVRSLWADQKVIIQESVLNKSLYRVFRGFESISASKSNGMSTLTRAVVPILEARNARVPALRTVVPTAVDLNSFKLNPIMPIKTKALFSGTFNKYYDLNLSKLFMDEFKRLAEVEIHWARPAESNRSQIDVGETEILQLNQIQMPEILADYCFGVSVCKMDSGPSLKAAMPTKIGEFLAVGRPVIVNKGLGDMDEFIQEFNAGIILDGSLKNLKESAEKLKVLIDDKGTPIRCRALAEKYFNMDKGADNYLNLYAEILNAKGP